MILRISKMLVMMALPIVLLACGGGESGPKTKASGMRFVLAQGQTLPSDIDTSKAGTLDFGETNFVGVEKGPVKYDLTNITEDSVTFIKTGLLGGRDDIFITASSCFETLAAKDSCSVTIALSPKEQNRSYKDDYSVEFYFGTDQSVTSEPVKLKLAARTFAGALDPVKGVPGLSVSVNYQELEFKDIILGTTSPSQVVNYFYYGEDTIVLNTKEAVVSAMSSIDANAKNTDKEMIVESTCGVMSYGDTCLVELFYRPAVLSTELDGNKIYSQIPISISGENLATTQSSTIIAKKHSKKPTPSLLMKFTKGDDAEYPADVKETLDTVVAGLISTTPKDVKLVRTAVDKDNTLKMFYRLESTNPAIQIDRNTCNLVLENPSTTESAKGNCTFKVSLSPASAGDQAGYIIATAGAERIFLGVTATASDSTKPILTDTVTEIDVDKVVVNTTVNTIAATKRIAVRYKDGATAKAFPFIVGMTDTTGKGLFSYTTTCVDNTALDADNSLCYVDIIFRGGADAGQGTATLNVIATNLTGAETVTVALEGNTAAVNSIPVSTETPVEGLTINVKSHVYPTTGIGLVSQTLQIELENTSAKAITGFGTTSTDLTTFAFSKTLSDDDKCDSTIGANKKCILGYTFNPRNSVEKTGYISIFDDTTAITLRDNEIIKVVGRGALFNEYLSFGVVAPSETKTLLAAYTNDGTSGLKIDTVSVHQYATMWKTAGFDDKKSLPVGNRVALIDTFFNQDNFTTNEVTASVNFKVLSSECSGITLDPGASCMIRLGFDAPATAVDLVDAEKNHYRAYVNVNTSNKIIDRLHVISSTQDNSTMYMFPHQDIDEKLDGTSTAKFELNDNISTVTTDKQFVVIGNDIYSYLGTDFRDSTGYKLSSDNKLRKYDASRNKWVILDPAGENPFVYTVGDTSAEPRLYLYGAQGKMVAHDGKLYVYGMSLSGTGSSKRRFDVYSYDPNFGTDGKWTNLGGSGGLHGASQLSLTAYKGKLYFFGGRGNKNSKVTIYDIASNTWSTHGDQVVADVPELRVGAATIVVPINKLIGTDNVSVPYLIMHGGSGTLDVNKTPINSIMYDVVLNDLWAMSLPYSVKKADGSVVEVTTGAYLWTKLQGKSASSDIENDKRPADRLFHSFEYYDGKLLLTPGFDGDDYNEDHKGGTHHGTKENYFVLDPAKLFKADGTLCNADSDVFCDAFTKFAGLKTEFLNMHLPATVSGDLWFHNWNILGVYFNKALEGGATK